MSTTCNSNHNTVGMAMDLRLKIGGILSILLIVNFIFDLSAGRKDFYNKRTLSLSPREINAQESVGAIVAEDCRKSAYEDYTRSFDSAQAWHTTQKNLLLVPMVLGTVGTITAASITAGLGAGIGTFATVGYEILVNAVDAQYDERMQLIERELEDAQSRCVRLGIQTDAELANLDQAESTIQFDYESGADSFGLGNIPTSPITHTSVEQVGC